MENKKLYALVTRQCNLSCPHCDVKNIEDDYNEKLFLEQLEQFDGYIILFGGECSLYPERLFELYYNHPIIQRKVRSISTNLIILDDKLLTLYQIIGSIGTSWNPHRFTHNEYRTWLYNINKIEGTKINVGALITLTDDLFEINIDNFINMISTWNDRVIQNINFEYNIADTSTPEYFERADNWLCELYNKWNSKIKIKNIDMVKNWYRDCSNVFSLYPNGELKSGCPHKMEMHVPIECYTCERSQICRPCQLQKYCAFPKKFAKLVSEKEKSKYEK